MRKLPFKIHGGPPRVELDDKMLYAYAKRDAITAYARRHGLTYKQAAAKLAPQFANQPRRVASR